MPTKPITLTLNASALRSLIGDVIPFADSDKWSLPILNTVHLLGHGDRITATATDRYVVGVKRAQIKAPVTLDAMIPLDAARRILTMFKASRKADPLLDLKFTDTQVTVETGAAFDGLALDARVSFALQHGEYPPLRGVFESCSGIPGEGSIGLNPPKVAQFKHLGPGLAYHVNGEGSPVIVRGKDFLGAIMPLCEFIRADQAWTTRDLSEWLPMLGGKSEKPAA